MTATHTRTYNDASYERLLVESILRNPLGFEWSLQGFGMLRLYLDKPNVRMHIWDPRYKVADVTEMHTHPWHFHSKVIAGSVGNTRYRVLADNVDHGVLFDQREIRCGEGGGETGRVDRVRLWREPFEHYVDGGTYMQRAQEIHVSDPAPGTVTIIRREMLDDTEHAYVYTKPGSEWVSAEPRPATDDEVMAICAMSLERWWH